MPKPLCHLKGCKNPKRGSIIEKEETKEREPNGMLKTFMPSKKVQKPTRRENQKASQRSTWSCIFGVGPSTPPNAIKMQNDQRLRNNKSGGDNEGVICHGSKQIKLIKFVEQCRVRK
jgi:hypothetical protein